MPITARVVSIQYLLRLVVLALCLQVGAAAADPREVRFGAFITSISDLDPDDGSFRMVGYIWTVDPAARFNPVGQIEVLARESRVQPIAQTVLPDGALYVAASFDAIADHDFDVRAYPFERSVLGLQFEAVEDATELVFAPDRADSRIADFAVGPGWHINALVLRVMRPGADAAGAEVAAGEAVAGVVEAEVGLATRAGPGLEEVRLGAVHVRAEAGQEHHARAPALAPAIGDAAAVGELQRRMVHAGK